MADTTHDIDARYLICKYDGYYRPNSRGYTGSAIQAGRYTLADAIQITHPNGPDGPRDGMTFIHEDKVLDADWTAYRAIQAERDAWKARAEAAEENVGILRASREALETQVAQLQRELAKAHSLGPSAKAEAALIRAKVGLVLARDELDQYSRQEYPLDHPVHERYRQRDYEANPARLALDAITPPADLAKGVADE